MKKNKISLVILGFIFIVLASCQDDNDDYQPVVESELNLPDTPFDYETLNLPSHFVSLPKN